MTNKINEYGIEAMPSENYTLGQKVHLWDVDSGGGYPVTIVGVHCKEAQRIFDVRFENGIVMPTVYVQDLSQKSQEESKLTRIINLVGTLITKMNGGKE